MRDGDSLRAMTYITVKLALSQGKVLMEKIERTRK